MENNDTRKKSIKDHLWSAGYGMSAVVAGFGALSSLSVVIYGLALGLGPVGVIAGVLSGAVALGGVKGMQIAKSKAEKIRPLTAVAAGYGLVLMGLAGGSGYNFEEPVQGTAIALKSTAAADFKRAVCILPVAEQATFPVLASAPKI